MKQATNLIVDGMGPGTRTRNTVTRFVPAPSLLSPIWKINGLVFWCTLNSPFVHVIATLFRWDWMMLNTLKSIKNWNKDGIHIFQLGNSPTSRWRSATSHSKLNLRMVPSTQSPSQLRQAMMKLIWLKVLFHNCKSTPKPKTWLSASTTSFPSQTLTTVSTRPWNLPSLESAKHHTMSAPSLNTTLPQAPAGFHCLNSSATVTNTSKSLRPPTTATVMLIWDTISESPPWATKSPDPTRWENTLPALTFNVPSLPEHSETTPSKLPSPSTRSLSAPNCSIPKRPWLFHASTWRCTQFKKTKEQRTWPKWFRPACTTSTTTLLKTKTISNPSHRRLQAQAPALPAHHQAAHHRAAAQVHHHHLLLHQTLAAQAHQMTPAAQATPMRTTSNHQSNVLKKSWRKSRKKKKPKTLRTRSLKLVLAVAFQLMPRRNSWTNTKKTRKPTNWKKPHHHRRQAAPQAAALPATHQVQVQNAILPREVAAHLLHRLMTQAHHLLQAQAQAQAPALHQAQTPRTHLAQAQATVTRAKISTKRLPQWKTLLMLHSYLLP